MCRGDVLPSRLLVHGTIIGIDLAGILGAAWRAPKVGRCSGVGIGRGVPSSAE